LALRARTAASSDVIGGVVGVVVITSNDLMLC
jgi:hypothetical protein